MSRFASRMLALALLLGVLSAPWLATGASLESAVAQDAATPCPGLTEEDAAAFAETLFGAWNAHDVDQIVALHAPNAVYHWGIGADSEGTDAIAAAQAAFFEAFPDIQVTIDRVWLAGSAVIVWYISTGVQETEFMGVPPSETSVTWTGLSVFQLACGQITEVWSEADHFGRVQQQGVRLGTPPEATPAA